jgi:hypothetical protein
MGEPHWCGLDGCTWTFDPPQTEIRPDFKPEDLGAAVTANGEAVRAALAEHRKQHAPQ